MIDKKKLFEVLYEGAPAVQFAILVDPNCSLPKEQMQQEVVILQVGWGQDRPPKDLSYDDTEIKVTLSFNGVDHFCRFPWAAVLQMTAHNNPKDANNTRVSITNWFDQFPTGVVAPPSNKPKGEPRPKLRSV